MSEKTEEKKLTKAEEEKEKKKEQEKKKKQGITSEVITIERLLEISTGLNMVMYNADVPNHLSFKIGLFKLEVDEKMKLYTEKVKEVNEEFRPYTSKDKKTGEKTLPPTKQKELTEKLNLLREEEVTVDLRSFRLVDFEDITVPPAFFTLMKDLVTE